MKKLHEQHRAQELQPQHDGQRGHHTTDGAPPWREDLESAFAKAACSLTEVTESFKPDTLRARADHQLSREAIDANAALSLSRPGEGQPSGDDVDRGAHEQVGKEMEEVTEPPRLVGIRSIRGMSLKVREQMLRGQAGSKAIRLQTCFKLIHSRPGEEKTEPFECELRAIKMYWMKRQRRVFSAFFDHLRHRQELRRKIAQRCSSRMEAVGSRHMHKSFRGIDMAQVRSREGLTGMAGQHAEWRAKAAAFARLMMIFAGQSGTKGFQRLSRATE